MVGVTISVNCGSLLTISPPFLYDDVEQKPNWMCLNKSFLKITFKNSRTGGRLVVWKVIQATKNTPPTDEVL